MAKYAGVWGIDIGQCAFKALRCKLGDDGSVVADAFDYIEYPKILSQPEADPAKTIREALEQFLSRNDIKGCRIALSVPGQSGLAKFFKPPPVEAKKIPEIVKFEARQQIPFPLEDVVWDFQQMGGAEADGFALETEVGLFAMKREQVYRAMRPFQDVGVELDIIQLAPLSIYNFVTHDILADRVDPDTYDPDNPPPSLVVLSMGTDTTDLVITNGFRVWQRSIPIGGNHFTKQLTKELKLTFAKAEHLKRNARQAEDPKMVFQAMRPVFNDMVTEVQRSIGYFQGIDRKAKIGGVVVLGNGVKLPGLQQYLSKNLGYEVESFEAFTKLSGQAVLSAPAFKDNQLSFGVAYGLCLQGLDQASLRTSLVPKEIVTDRLVRAKKPWVVATVGSLLLGCTFYLFFEYGKLHQVSEDRAVAGVSWKDAGSAVDQAKNLSSGYESEDQTLVADLARITAIGEELVGNADRRVLWMEILKAVNEALPRTPGLQPGEIPDVEKVPFDQRQEIHVSQLETQHFSDLSNWFTDGIKQRYVEQSSGIVDPAADGTAPATVAQTPPSGSATAGPEGPKGDGWVFELRCYHYFNSDPRTQGIAHVLDTLVKNLRTKRVVFPVPVAKIVPGVVVMHQAAPERVLPLRVVSSTPVLQPNADGTQTLSGYQVQLEGLPQPIAVPADESVPVGFTMKELGIEYPVITSSQPINKAYRIANPNYAPPALGTPGAGGSPGGAGLPGMPMASGAGSGAGMSLPPSGGSAPLGSGMPLGSGGSSAPGESESNEPQYLSVPRYVFNIQFTWTEKPLSKRLEEQAKEWQAEQQKQGSQPAGGGLASNRERGA